MGAVPVQISGVLFDKLNRTQQLVLLMGELTISGLSVGGGPIIPPDSPPNPGDPPHIWGGGNVPMPNPPIANVPGAPGYRPPGIWGGGNEGFPTPPIYLPPVQPPKPPDSDAVKPPPPDGGWGYFPEYGWGYFPKSGEPGPKG